MKKPWEKKQKILIRIAIMIIIIPVGIFAVLNLYHGNLTAAEKETKAIREVEKIVSFPFYCLPKYQLKEGPDMELIKTEGVGQLEVPTNEIALVLIDTWNHDDPDEGELAPEYLNNLKSFLNKCRENGVTVIHAPNSPVVDKYPQYHSLKKEVEHFMNDYTEKQNTSPFLQWPPKNRYREKIIELRQEAKKPSYQKNPTTDRDISSLLRPIDSEYVLSSHAEYRYILWKEKIKVILYAGGSITECMLHRDTGINLLAGIDKRNTQFSIVVLEDCVYSINGPKIDYETSLQAMLDYYKLKIAVVSNSQQMVFK